MTDPRLAALWLDALQRLADRAAHELNNALNGVVVNLEVVRVRARPEADAGRVASFAEAAIEQAEGATALAGALLALSRPPRPGAWADAGAVARQVTTLLAPAVAHHGVRVWLEESDAAPVPADPVGVRAALALALLDAAAVADSSALPAELGGANSADVAFRRVRCTVSSEPGVSVRIEPPGGPGLPEPAVALLRAAGVDVTRGADAVTLTFREPGPGT